MISPPGESRRLSMVERVGVFLFSLLLLCVNLGGPVLSRHEVLAAQPAREMLATGDWIIPRFVGEPRLVKPPTTGWVLAAAMWITGSRAEWVVRLPGVMAGALCCVLTASLTARMVNRRAGLYAGLLQATSYFILMQARLAEADIFLCLAVMVAMAMLIRFCLDGDPRPAFWRSVHVSAAFYAATGAAFLFKGPVGTAFVLFTTITYIAWSRDGRVMRLLVNPVGLAVFFLVAGVWPLLAWRAYPPIADVWFRETGGRFAGDMGDPEPWWFYLVNVPLLLLPWFPLAIVGAIIGMRHRWYRTPAARLLLCWLGAGLVLLSVSAWKHKHYAIPIIPSILPATAMGLVAWLQSAHRQSRPRPMPAIVCVVVTAAIMILVGRKAIPGDASAIVAVAVVFVAGSLEFVIADWRRCMRGSAAAILATAWLTTAMVEWKVLPRFDGYRAFADFAAQVDSVVPGTSTICLVNLGEHHIAYYIDHAMQRVEADAEDPEWMTQFRPADYLLVESTAAASWQTHAARQVLIEMPLTVKRKYSRLSLLQPLDRSSETAAAADAALHGINTIR